MILYDIHEVRRILQFFTETNLCSFEGFLFIGWVGWLVGFQLKSVMLWQYQRSYNVWRFLLYLWLIIFHTYSSKKKKTQIARYGCSLNCFVQEKGYCFYYSQNQNRIKCIRFPLISLQSSPTARIIFQSFLESSTPQVIVLLYLSHPPW